MQELAFLLIVSLPIICPSLPELCSNLMGRVLTEDKKRQSLELADILPAFILFQARMHEELSERKTVSWLDLDM